MSEPAAAPSPSRFERRVALAALAVSIAFFVGVALFGLDAPLQWGHYGHHLADYTLRARNTLRFGMLVPAVWSGATPPPQDSLYLNHPVLAHHFLTVAYALFGEHLWIARAVAASWGLSSLVATFVLVRRHWGPLPGAAAVLAFATLPFHAAFGVHYDPGYLAMPGVLIATDAWMRHRDAPRPATALAASAGLALAGLSEWTPYLVAAFFLPLALVLGGSSAGRAGLLGLRPPQRLAIALGLVLLATLALHVAVARWAGAASDLTRAYQNRSAHGAWATTASRQSTYFAAYFGAPYLVVGALWVAAVARRTHWSRSRGRDLLPLAWLSGWILYVRLFPVAVDIHGYRTMPLGAFFPLALATVVAEAPSAFRWVTSRVPALAARAELAPYAVVLAVLVPTLPRTLATLVAARATAGTLGARSYSPHREQFLFADAARERVPRDALVVAHKHLGARTELMMLFDRELVRDGSLTAPDSVPESRPLFLAWDHDKLEPRERMREAELVADHGAFLVGPFTLVDVRSREPAVDARRIVAGDATMAWRYLSSWTQPPLHLEPGYAEVAAPASSDLESYVDHLDYLVARRGPEQERARALAGLAGVTQPGPTVGPVRVVGWQTAGSRLRLVLASAGAAVAGTRLAVRARSARGDRVLPLAPRTPDEAVDRLRPGFFYVFGALLPGSLGRDASLSIELFEPSASAGGSPSPAEPSATAELGALAP